MATAGAPRHIWLCSSHWIWNISSIEEILFPPYSGACRVFKFHVRVLFRFCNHFCTLHTASVSLMELACCLPRCSYRHITWFMLECLWLWWDEKIISYENFAMPTFNAIVVGGRGHYESANNENFIKWCCRWYYGKISRYCGIFASFFLWVYKKSNMLLKCLGDVSKHYYYIQIRLIF